MDLLFRINTNAWGQEILTGISWDLFWFFLGAGALFIVVHAFYMQIWSPRMKKP